MSTGEQSILPEGSKDFAQTFCKYTEVLS